MALASLRLPLRFAPYIHMQTQARAVGWNMDKCRVRVEIEMARANESRSHSARAAASLSLHSVPGFETGVPV